MEMRFRPPSFCASAICFVGALLIQSSLVSGEILRLSKVTEEESSNTERFELANGDKREVLFVEKQAIITDADVKSAMRSPQQAHALAVTLTDKGGKKIGAATNDAHGDMRIAMLINGKVVAAPTVNMKLGKHFIVDGLKEYPNDDLDLIGWQIEGKSDEQIAELIREKETKGEAPPPPRPQPQYYNDEEYAALKKEREKMGVFYLDELPTKEELDKQLMVGMEEKDVIAKFGIATRSRRDDEGRLTSVEFELAPEKRSISNEMRPNGFLVQFSEEKVARWSFHQRTNAPRQAKPPARGRSALTGKIPHANMGAEDFNFVRWAEEIELELKEGQEKLTPQDQADLISILWSVAQAADDDLLIEANCSVVTLLATDFPEVAELRKTSKDGKIRLSKLKELVEPYINGEKKLPESANDSE